MDILTFSDLIIVCLLVTSLIFSYLRSIKLDNDSQIMIYSFEIKFKLCYENVEFRLSSCVFHIVLLAYWIHHMKMNK